MNSILKSNILDILYKVESEIKDLFIKFDVNNLNLLIEETNNLKLINKNLLNKDFKTLVNKFKFWFKFTQLIREFTVETKDMKDNWQDLNNLINTLVNDSTLEELFSVINWFNNYSLDNIDISLNRNEILSDNSIFFKHCENIMNLKNIHLKMKQILLEKFILDYESNYTKYLIANVNDNSLEYKLLQRLIKHVETKFKTRINVLVDNHIINHLKLYNKNRNNLANFGTHLALVLFILLKPNTIADYLLTKVLRVIGSSGGVQQTELVGLISKEMLENIKVRYSKIELFKNSISEEKLYIVKDVLESDLFKNLTIENQMEFGHLLFTILMGEFKFMFTKETIMENGEHHYSKETVGFRYLL
ncbi:RNA polymerase (mitochondrion) [Armillaria borealis]|uniref:RNA polymerase n=1 Tax=Armillaria borealis TaxID=47425 RepID=A0A4D6FEY4_9AGAR|nr:RNA polymerase [Armillaria borealis]QCB16405.1 RNA polymerase [Armillaria borealis]